MEEEKRVLRSGVKVYKKQTISNPPYFELKSMQILAESITLQGS